MPLAVIINGLVCETNTSKFTNCPDILAFFAEIWLYRVVLQHTIYCALPANKRVTLSHLIPVMLRKQCIVHHVHYAARIELL